MICKRCGKEIDEDTVWCLNCGEKVNESVEPINNNFSTSASNCETISTDNKNESIESSASTKTQSTKLSPGPLIGGILLCYLVPNIIWLLLTITIAIDNNVGFLLSASGLLCWLTWTSSHLFVGIPIRWFSNDYINLDGITQGQRYLLSFYNGLFGGIFGLLFNHNCNRNKKGYSNFIVGVLVVVGAIIFVIVFWNLIYSSCSYCWSIYNFGFIFVVFIIFYIIVQGASFIATGYFLSS